jgi:hypothetical protein
MFEFDEYGHGYRYDHSRGFRFYSHLDNTNPQSTPEESPGSIGWGIVCILAGFILLYAALAVALVFVAGVLVYTVSRVVLAPLSSMIDIYVNWGNLYHLRSKKALQYQLLSLCLLGIGGFLFCTS